MKITIEIPYSASPVIAAEYVTAVADQVNDGWDHGVVSVADGVPARWEIEE